MILILGIAFFFVFLISFVRVIPASSDDSSNAIAYLDCIQICGPPIAPSPEDLDLDTLTYKSSGKIAARKACIEKCDAEQNVGTEGAQQEQQIKSESEDSALLLESILNMSGRKHNEEADSLKIYYMNSFVNFEISKQWALAKKKFEETKPLGLEVANAKNDYQNAIEKRASKTELAQLKASYEQKIQELKNSLKTNVLTEDKSNVDALWQMGTLSKWEGNNRESYEHYRDALVAAKNRNFFQYQGLLDSINNPGIRMRLLQSMEPDEEIIKLPTTETSPFLNWLDKNVKKIIEPVTEAKRAVAEKIEKISRFFSISEQLNAAGKELGFSVVGGENE